MIRAVYTKPRTFAQTGWRAHTLRMLRIRRVIFWQAIAVAFAIALAIALSHFFPVVTFVDALRERVMDWGAWAGIFYPLLFAACNILLLPGGFLAVGGGFFFGLWWGFLIVFAGNIISTAISFALSRFVAKRWFRRKLLANPTLMALGPAVRRESWKIVLLSQLHPLFPTSLLNYFYGLTRIRFRTYMLCASIGRMPGLFLYAYVGTVGQLGLRTMRGKSQPHLIEYWKRGGAFLTTALLLLVLGRIASRVVHAGYESERPPPSEKQKSQRKQSVEHRYIS